MAVVHGKNGCAAIKDGTAISKIMNITAWTVNEINEVAEARVMEEDYVLRYQGMRDWNVSLEGLAESTIGAAYLTSRIATGTPGNTLPSATLFIRLRNNIGTIPVYEGSGVMTDFSYASSADGVPTFSATIAGNGALRFVERGD